MVQSVELVYNQALSLAGSKGQVTSASETSREAELCTVWYETVRDNVMKAAPWASLRQDARLVEAAERNWGADWVSGDPAPQFTWAFTLPANMLAPRFIHSGARFEIAPRSGILELMSNDETPILRYTANDVAVADWDQGLFTTIVTMLAYQISFELTKKVSLTDRLLQRAYASVLMQRAQEANEQQIQYRAIPEILTARGYDGFTSQLAYYYPYENLLGVAL